MAKIIKLTEKQLKNVISEMMDVSSDSDYYKKRKRVVEIPFDDLSMLGAFATNYCADKMGNPDCKHVYSIYRSYNLMF
jgi:hypothetical protein